MTASRAERLALALREVDALLARGSLREAEAAARRLVAEHPLAASAQFVMLAFGAFIMFAADVKAKDIAHSSVFIAGMIAVVSIFGIAWMSDTFISANKKFLVDNIGIMVKMAPWTFAIATFCISAFVKSQAATLAITLPLGLALGLSPRQVGIHENISDSLGFFKEKGIA